MALSVYTAMRQTWYDLCQSKTEDHSNRKVCAVPRRNCPGRVRIAGQGTPCPYGQQDASHLSMSMFFCLLMESHGSIIGLVHEGLIDAQAETHASTMLG